MEKTVEKRCILIVDDDPGVRASLGRMLADEDYAVITASNGEEALAALSNRRVHLVLSDEQMPGMRGTELLAHLHRLQPAVIRMLLTGKPSVATAMRAVNAGETYRFFTKPWDEGELLAAIRQGLEKYALEEENRMLLRTIKKQTNERAMLEQQYPGITSLVQDADNAIIAEDVSPEEIAEIKLWCRRQVLLEAQK